MHFTDIQPRDRRLFDAHLNRRRRRLSVSAFEAIYIWKGLFEIFWTMIEGHLCIFFKDSVGCFLYLPPLAPSGMTWPGASVIDACFKTLDTFNRNPEVSRIENIEAEDVPYYESAGYRLALKSYDYLSRRSELVRLSGNRFKSKRACCNYFSKQYAWRLLPFSLSRAEECLALYDLWAGQREQNNKSAFYRGMLKDSRSALAELFGAYRRLRYTGKMVTVDGRIKAFTLGFGLSPDTFCVSFEVCDLSVKGIAQFIFREFCRGLNRYTYINCMDDSGLENLKIVKLSYRPVELIPAYIATRRNA